MMVRQTWNMVILKKHVIDLARVVGIDIDKLKEASACFSEQDIVLLRVFDLYINEPHMVARVGVNRIAANWIERKVDNEILND